MARSRDVAQLKLFGVSILIFFCATAIPQKVLAESYISTTNLMNLESDRLENSNLHSSQNLEQEANTTDNEKRDIQFRTNSQPVEVSRGAVDLLLVSEVDLDALCQAFPLNSRCVDYQRTPSRQNLETRLLERLATASATSARSGFALGGKVGTLGVGIEGVGAISPNFNGRLGFNYLGFSGEFNQRNVDYDGDVQLLNATGMLDWFPSSESGFRVTGGLVYQNNRVDAIARSTETLEIGGIEFPVSAVGQLQGTVTFPNTVAPYIGIGYGNSVRRGSGLSFNIDLGVLFPGSPQASLQATGSGVDMIEGIPELQNMLNDAIAQEENDIEEDLRWLGVYPVVSIGVSYQF